MTVGRVYWLFDVFILYVRTTNPFGGGDEKSGGSGGEGISPNAEVIHQKSGFQLWSSLNASKMQQRKVGIDTFKSIDDLRVKNPHMADFLSDIKKGEFK